jgi:Zn finger protein HypA/HybF involved in hydrogenase expression
MIAILLENDKIKYVCPKCNSSEMPIIPEK